MLKMYWTVCLLVFALGSDFMFRLTLFFLTLGVLSACMPQPAVPTVSNPFPISPVSDSQLASDFQDLSTETALLTYQLTDIRKGTIADGQTYQLGFVAPPNHDLVLVVSCGTACGGAFVRVAEEGGNAQKSTIFRGVRAYAYHSVGSKAEALVAEISLKSCDRLTCSTYVALYARAR